MNKEFELSEITPYEIGLLKYIKIPEILHDLKKKWRGWFSSPIRIVVYGESGSGKTQFLHTILGKEVYNEQRTQNFKNYILKLDNGYKVEFIDTPGNKSLSSIRKELQKKFVKGEISGVINIVANGFQSSPDVDLSKVFQSGTNIVKPDYLRTNMKMELDQLGEWIDYIDSESNVRWFITIVNKADIWYADKVAAMDYYQNGEYYNAVKELRHVCSLKFFPYCSIIAPFCGKTMELVMSQKDQRAMHKEFFDSLVEMVNYAKQ